MIDLDGIRVIITDLDGTLIELKIEYTNARKEAIKILEDIYPFPKNMFSTRDSLFQMSDKSEKFLRNMDRDSLIPEVNEKLIDIADRYEMDAARRTKPLPRAPVSLNKLRDMGIEMILLTTCGKKSSEYVLSRFDMQDYFKHIFTRECMFNVKQHPNYLLNSLKRIGIEPKRSLLVGDSVSDILCGKAINARTVGVASGMSKPEQLAQSGADYLIDSFPQLLGLLRANSQD